MITVYVLRMVICREEISLKTLTGEMRCEVFRPEGDRVFPTLIFYSEIFQITEPIARTAAFMAGHGYCVVVPEVFHELNEAGVVLAYDDLGKDKGNSDKFTKKLTAHDSDTEAILKWVGEKEFCSGSVGAFGVCLGGHLAFRAALNAQVSAVSCLYATDLHSNTIPEGEGEQTLALAGKSRAEFMMVWGKQDPHVSEEGRRIIYRSMGEQKVNFSWHEFNAQHAFIRDEGNRYDPELASICYDLTLKLFARTLY